MKFTKMQGIGNDYVYVNCFEEKVEDPSALAIQVSDRHFGIEEKCVEMEFAVLENICMITA